MTMCVPSRYPLVDSLMMRSGATFATLMGAGATVLVFKLSELATTRSAHTFVAAMSSHCSGQILPQTQES